MVRARTMKIDIFMSQQSRIVIVTALSAGNMAEGFVLTVLMNSIIAEVR